MLGFTLTLDNVPFFFCSFLVSERNQRGINGELGETKLSNGLDCQSIDHGTNTCLLQIYNYYGGASNTSRKRQNTEQGFQPSEKRTPPHSLPQTCKLYNHFNDDCKFGELCTFQHRCDICSKHGHPRSRCPDQLKSKGPQ